MIERGITHRRQLPTLRNTAQWAAVDKDHVVDAIIKLHQRGSEAICRARQASDDAVVTGLPDFRRAHASIGRVW